MIKVQIKNPKGFYVLIDKDKGVILESGEKPFKDVPFARKKKQRGKFYGTDRWQK